MTKCDKGGKGSQFYPQNAGQHLWMSLKQEMIELQWHQLDHMQTICTLLQRDNRASTLSLSLLFLMPNQRYQNCEGTCSHENHEIIVCNFHTPHLPPVYYMTNYVVLNNHIRTCNLRTTHVALCVALRMSRGCMYKWVSK